jgi:hypothetical protein
LVLAKIFRQNDTLNFKKSEQCSLIERPASEKKGTCRAGSGSEERIGVEHPGNG